MFLAGAVWYAPIPFLSFPNDITSPPPPMYNYARLPLPNDLTYPWKNATAFFTFKLSTKTDYVVGEPLTLTIVVEIPVAQSSNIEIINVETESALRYSTNTSAPVDFAFLFLTHRADVQGTRRWLNSQLIEYTVTGSFGFTVTIFRSSDLALAYQFKTAPMFSIASRDLLISKRNLALTTALTFLILFFAVLEFIRIDKGQRSSIPRNGP
jgi:hypothetical protein